MDSFCKTNILVLKLIPIAKQVNLYQSLIFFFLNGYLLQFLYSNNPQPFLFRDTFPTLNNATSKDT